MVCFLHFFMVINTLRLLSMGTIEFQWGEENRAH